MPASRTLRLGIATLVACLGLAAGHQSAQSQPSLSPALLIGRGTQMIDVNMGYGRWLDPTAPRGSFGFGVGFLHFPSDYGAVGVDVTADRLGKRGPAPGAPEEDLELISVLAQGLIHPAEKNLTPYLGVGAGPYFFRSSNGRDEQAGTNWGLMGRAGVRMVGWRPILGLDLRHHWIFLDPEDPASPLPGQKLTRAMSLKFTLSFLF